MTKDLLSWFEAVKRDLPWRKNRSPYRVWLSEIMLQQTQVKTVIPYFERWLKRFPTVQDLARADIDDVLKLWEGLGYYRRARNLHKAAQVVVFEKGGTFPDTYKDWLELPGVGPYSAAAISSIMNGEAVVAVDGNVKRVAARFFMLEGVIKENEVRERLTPFISQDAPGAFNEAMMELGATLCKKQTPACLYCPLSKNCLAYQQGRTADYPAPKVRTKRPHYEKYALIDISKGKIWLRQRSENEMLNGLWGFVLVDKNPNKANELGRVKHAYTHFSLGVTAVIQKVDTQEGKYVAIKRLDELALSTLDHKLLTLIESSL